MKPINLMEAVKLHRDENAALPFSFIYRSPITGQNEPLTMVGETRFIHATHWPLYLATELQEKTRTA